MRQPADDRAVTADRFPHLLSPLTIGRVTVRNRAFSSAHGTGFAVNGLLSERHIEYHRARARGGIGLIVVVSFYLSTFGQAAFGMATLGV